MTVADDYRRYWESPDRRHGFNRISTESGLRHADWLWASAWKPAY